MTPDINVTPFHDAEGRQHLLDMLPTLQAMDDAAAVDALIQLFDLGVEAGTKSSQEVIKDLGQWLSRLALAHVKKDAIGVKAILDEFIAARCVIKGGPAPTTSH